MCMKLPQSFHTVANLFPRKLELLIQEQPELHNRLFLSAQCVSMDTKNANQCITTPGYCTENSVSAKKHTNRIASFLDREV